VYVIGVLRRFQQSFSHIPTVAASCMRRDSARVLSAAKETANTNFNSFAFVRPEFEPATSRLRGECPHLSESEKSVHAFFLLIVVNVACFHTTNSHCFFVFVSLYVRHTMTFIQSSV